MHLDRLTSVPEIVGVAGLPAAAAENRKAGGRPRPARCRPSQILCDQGLIASPGDAGRFVIGAGPLHAASRANAIGAFAEPALRARVAGGRLSPFTAFTKATELELRAEFAATLEQGCADCDPETDRGIASIAAPVRNDAIGATFSIGAVGPIRRFDAARRAEVGRRLAGVARGPGGATALRGIEKEDARAPRR